MNGIRADKAIRLLCDKCVIRKSCGRYLHFLRHYNDARVEAGYHNLNKLKIPCFDESVEDLREMWRQLCIKTNVTNIDTKLYPLKSFFLEKEYGSLGAFPNSASSVFPRV